MERDRTGRIHSLQNSRHGSAFAPRQAFANPKLWWRSTTSPAFLDRGVEYKVIATGNIPARQSWNKHHQGLSREAKWHNSGPQYSLRHRVNFEIRITRKQSKCVKDVDESYPGSLVFPGNDCGEASRRQSRENRGLLIVRRSQTSCLNLALLQ